MGVKEKSMQHILAVQKLSIEQSVRFSSIKKTATGNIVNASNGCDLFLITNITLAVLGFIAQLYQRGMLYGLFR